MSEEAYEFEHITDFCECGNNEFIIIDSTFTGFVTVTSDKNLNIKYLIDEKEKEQVYLAVCDSCQKAKTFEIMDEIIDKKTKEREVVE